MDGISRGKITEPYLSIFLLPLSLMWLAQRFIRANALAVGLKELVIVHRSSQFRK
jgi:hypothetical protein